MTFFLKEYSSVYKSMGLFTEFQLELSNFTMVTGTLQSVIQKTSNIAERQQWDRNRYNTVLSQWNGLHILCWCLSANRINIEAANQKNSSMQHVCLCTDHNVLNLSQLRPLFYCGDLLLLLCFMCNSTPLNTMSQQCKSAGSLRLQLFTIYFSYSFAMYQTCVQLHQYSNVCSANDSSKHNTQFDSSVATSDHGSNIAGFIGKIC